MKRFLLWNLGVALSMTVAAAENNENLQQDVASSTSIETSDQQLDLLDRRSHRHGSSRHHRGNYRSHRSGHRGSIHHRSSGTTRYGHGRHSSSYRPRGNYSRHRGYRHGYRSRYRPGYHNGYNRYPRGNYGYGRHSGYYGNNCRTVVDTTYSCYIPSYINGSYYYKYNARSYDYNSAFQKTVNRCLSGENGYYDYQSGYNSAHSWCQQQVKCEKDYDRRYICY